jgi:V8-like Glu-specific endopeptidase
MTSNIHLSCLSAIGQSGSPVLDENGNVIGILTAMGGESEANTYAVTSKALIGLLHDQLDGHHIRLNKSNKLRNLKQGAAD